ncbi:MAG: hypothetical protein HY513_05630 [Candidatus Aenigmarchaeota archaeon]|nr:hypothetical protein [Candidatus Aenigmarchaeota archaeon]
MKGIAILVLVPLVILATMMIGIGIYFLVFKGTAGELIAWVSPFAQGIPEAIG